MNETIVQIIPAPVGLNATWVSDGEQKRIKVSCLALVEDKDGGRAVKPMAIHNESDIQIIPNEVSLRYVM